MADKSVEKMTFEEAMAALEAVVGQLEAGDVALEDSITLYERGAALKAHCEARLRAAEEKVAAITLDESGRPSGLAPLAEAGAAPAGDDRAARAGPGTAKAPASVSDDEIPF